MLAEGGGFLKRACLKLNDKEILHAHNIIHVQCIYWFCEV